MQTHEVASTHGLRFAVFALTAVVPICGCNSVLGISPPLPADASTDAPDGEAASGADAAQCRETGPCTPFPQCGCEGTLNCEVTSPDGTTSCSLSTNAPLYHLCTSFGACPKGSSCVGGVCKPFCSTSADCVGPHRTCEQITANGTLNGPPVPGFKVCSSGCDPTAPSAICGPDVACFPWPFDGKMNDFGDCFGKAGTGIGKGTCSGTNQTDCAPGYYCSVDGDCVAWCRVGHPEDCNIGTCTPFSDVPVSIAGVKYGICQ